MSRTKDASPAPSSLNAFIGGGKMGELIRSKDWSQTPLGPIETWPPSLLTAASLVLNSNFPMNLAWGPQHVQIYNDGYMPMIAGKHPSLLGQDFRESWATVWAVIGADFEKAWQGKAAFLEDQRMFLDRLGFLEEAFFTLSFSPIRDEQGKVAGLFTPVTEITSKMLSQRRTRTLRDLTASGLQTTSLDQALQGCAQALTEALFDVPFALFYRIDASQPTAHLVAQTGLAPGTAASPIQIDLDSPDLGWPLAQAMQNGTVLAVNDLQARFPGLVCDPYPEPITAARVFSIKPPSHEQTIALLIMGVSTRLPMNQDYADFYELLGTSVTSVVASALAVEAERLRAEALAEIDRAKTAFFANISHEFRTPLTLMLAPLEDELAEQSEPLPTLRHERLAAAHRNALRLLKLANTLLDFSRIEAGRAQAHYQPTDLAALTSNLAGMFRAAIERADLTLSVDCPTLPEPLFLDQEMWEKIVLNLLSNALKHTFSGGIRVALRVVGDQVELAVTDTGVGIPADDLPHLFERFHRVVGARSRTHEGTGIGLALVQELVQLHGGSVTVTSVEGQGSTFKVRLKRGASHLPAVQISEISYRQPSSAATYIEEAKQWIQKLPAAPEIPDANNAALPHILWADDNTDLREYVQHLLSKDYRVTAVANGEEAVASAFAQPPDLVLTDIMMPGLDGLGLLRALRADPRTQYIPLILLSARAGEEESVSGLAEGADDYIVKPFAARELLARVRTHIKLSKMRRDWAQSQAHVAEVERNEAEIRKQLEAAANARRALLNILEDQKRSEAALSQSRETLRLTLDAASIGHWDLDIRTHVATRSLQHDQIFGYGELLPNWTYETFLSHVHPDDRERVDQTFQTGVAAKSEWDIECRIVRADSTLRWIWAHGKVFSNAAGEAAHLLGMVSDITARKQLELTILASENEFRTLAEAMPQIVWAAGADGLTSYLNQNWASYTGLSLQESYGEGWVKPIHPDDRQSVWIAWQNAVNHFEPYSIEARLRRADGAYRWWLIRGVPVLDASGKISKWFGTCTDIENIKQNEASLREKNAELERFTYMVSHDLKSPLVTIKTFLAYLEQDMAKPDAARIEQDIGYIGTAAEKMGRMLEELLEFSRVGRVSAQLIPIDWLSLMNETLRLIAGAIAQRGVEVELEQATLLLQGDRARLMQLWQNLIDNAVKFAGEQASPKIRIGVEGQGKERVFFVCDNGIGIEPRYHDKIFGLFEKLDARAQGTGLGLAMVKRVVEQYGGTIQVESSGFGSGTCFRFTLPNALKTDQ